MALALPRKYLCNTDHHTMGYKDRTTCQATILPSLVKSKLMVVSFCCVDYQSEFGRVVKSS